MLAGGEALDVSFDDGGGVLGGLRQAQEAADSLACGTSEGQHSVLEGGGGD